jgi:environmental stress-induced protein Ves
MQLTPLPFAGYRRVAWRNGGGQAMDIAVLPAATGSTDDFAWRVALAEIERDGPFSRYGKGIERIITLLNGDGFDLDFVEAPGIAVRESHMPARFRGEWTTGCRLQDGRCVVFNVMYDEALYTAQFNIIRPLPNQPLIFSPPGRTTLLFCLAGANEIKADDSNHHLNPWDSLRIDLGAGEAPLLTLTARATDSRLLLVGFEPLEAVAR